MTVRTFWTEYCSKLRESDVQAFGITDYFSADGYIATVAAYRKRYKDCRKVFFPNIELRTNEVVNKDGQHVHIHLLFNSFQPDYQENIEKILGLLETNRTGPGNRKITVRELSGMQDLEAATTTKDSIHDALKKTYGPGADLSDYVLIISAVNDGGIRTGGGSVSGAKRKEEISDELDKLSDAFFGNANNFDHYLKTDRYKAETSKPKPTLTGCDAHSFVGLDERLGKVVYGQDQGIVFQPTWIKADLTFEGLKQILFEPANRVFIGEEPEVERRVKAHKNKYIESLYISSVDGYTGRCGTWFSEERIPLGKELVAIIGNKGSGKSAVADIVGLLGNSHNQRIAERPEELFSFLNKQKFRKGNCADNFFGELHWHDGVPVRKKLSADASDSLPERVEYLPQKYLERICADIADDDFRSTLNEVIFGYVKQGDQYGKKTFDELIQYLTEQVNEDIAIRRLDLHQANEKVVSIERKLTANYRDEVEGKLAIRKQDLKSHRNVIPPAKNPPDPSTQTASPEAATIEQIAAEIETLKQDESKTRNEQVGTKRSLEDLKRIRQDIERATTAVAALKRTHEAALKEAGLSFDKIVTLAVDYTDLDQLISEKDRRAKKIDTLLATAEDIEGEMESPQDRAARVAASIVCKRVALEQQKTDLIDRLAAPRREYQAYVDAMAIWSAQESALLGDPNNPAPESVRGLERELENMETLYPQELATAKAERDAVAVDIFQKMCGLTEFYESVKRSIDAEIARHKADLNDYNISVEAGLRFEPSFYDKFFEFTSQGVKGSFNGVEDGRTFLKGLCESASSWEDDSEVFRLINEIVDALHVDKRQAFAGEARDIFKQMRGERSPIELYDYLFGFNYLSTKYDLMVDKKDLSELSPGERGGLLLIFYLMLDKEDIPLVIDQPEDNLDNESVYQILATFLKKAKKRRQIIMVTHNPNLAVGADAEQIIRVSIDKKQGKNEFDFYSGSIENPKLNKAVVDILEGTLPAFDNRRLKYRRR